MARHFEQRDDWENELLTCLKCGWQGTFNQGDVEIHEAVMDCSCPICESPDDPMLAIVSLIVDKEKYSHFEMEDGDDKEEEGDSRG